MYPDACYSAGLGTFNRGLGTTDGSITTGCVTTELSPT